MSDSLLSVRNLGVRFGAFSALEDISFDLREGETLGLVGESGSGKSTLARALLRLIPATAGRVSWRGDDLLACEATTLRRYRRDLQIVFQDPLASLNPRMRVGDALSEPLKIFERELSAAARRPRIAAMLERVGLSPDMADRYPHEFSGGQCQRIGIARAMMLRPKLLVCDEPVSSLDVSVQGQIVNLLVDLQREFGTAMLFISHNLAVVRHLSHRVMFLYRGRMAELADCDDLFALPVHPYTRALLAAVPVPKRQAARAAFTAAAGVPFADGAAPAPRSQVLERPATQPQGTPPQAPLATLPQVPETWHTSPPHAAACVFHDRCPYAKPLCRHTSPPLQEVFPRHVAACHRWREVVYS